MCLAGVECKSLSQVKSSDTFKSRLSLISDNKLQHKNIINISYNECGVEPTQSPDTFAIICKNNLVESRINRFQDLTSNSKKSRLQRHIQIEEEITTL